MHPGQLPPADLQELQLYLGILQFVLQRGHRDTWLERDMADENL